MPTKEGLPTINDIIAEQNKSLKRDFTHLNIQRSLYSNTAMMSGYATFFSNIMYGVYQFEYPQKADVPIIAAFTTAAVTLLSIYKVIELNRKEERMKNQLMVTIPTTSS